MVALAILPDLDQPLTDGGVIESLPFGAIAVWLILRYAESSMKLCSSIVIVATLSLL